MAFTTRFAINNPKLGPPGTMKLIYNFTFPVSTFGGGSKDDVMLLQSLFRIFYYEFEGQSNTLETPPARPPGSNGVIKIDGIVGKQTGLHIMHFQRLLQAAGDSGKPDGVMDPMKKQGVLTSRTHKHYQIEILNAKCLKIAIGAGREEVHQRMIDDDVHPDIPDELRVALTPVVFIV